MEILQKSKAMLQKRSRFRNILKIYGVQELKIYHGPGYRVYFGRDGSNIVILLCGGDKSDQKKDITLAKELWREYKNAS